MSYEWIKASLALDYVSDGHNDYASRVRICQRAHAGLVASRADKIVRPTREDLDLELDKGFWWAGGREALRQDWEAGDFTTWIDEKIEIKAFGVSFDFIAISELVPAEKRAAALRRISALSQKDWISARDLARRLKAETGQRDVERAIVEFCQIGQISGRALLATGVVDNNSSLSWRAREWDIPLWFWREFATSNYLQDWELNKAHGRGMRGRWLTEIELQGVHFHRSGLASIGLGEREGHGSPQQTSQKGRKPKYDWPAATVSVFGQIYRGILQPNSQADVERALIEHLSEGDDEPSPSSVRPYAKLVWTESQKN